MQNDIKVVAVIINLTDSVVVATGEVDMVVLIGVDEVEGVEGVSKEIEEAEV